MAHFSLRTGPIKQITVPGQRIVRREVKNANRSKYAGMKEVDRLYVERKIDASHREARLLAWLLAE
jgi:hypothetical protein